MSGIHWHQTHITAPHITLSQNAWRHGKRSIRFVNMVPSCVLPLSMLSVACEVWKHCCFYEFCLAAFCSMLLCLYAMSCLSYVAMSCLFYGAIVYIVIVFNNLPRDCGWKLAGWLKPSLLLKRWLMCTVPEKINSNSNSNKDSGKKL